MSGIEIIGLVLGVAPLLISALEGCQKLGKTYSAFRSKQLHIDRMVRAMKWQQSLIQSDVKLVLRSAGVDTSEIDQQAGIGKLQNVLARADIERALDAFLGDNLAAYLDVLTQCNETFLRVAKAIKGYESASAVALGSLSTIIYVDKPTNTMGSEFWKRFKFSMHKADLEDNIKQIDHHSQLLERLREKSQQNQQASMLFNSAYAPGVVSMLRKVHDRAAMLYQGLSQGWTSSCQGVHNARLYLDNRIDAFEAEKKSRSSRKESLELSLVLQGCASPQFQLCTVNGLAIEEDDDDDSETGKRSRIVFQGPASVSKPPDRTRFNDICTQLGQFPEPSTVLQLFIAGRQRLTYELIEPDSSDHIHCHRHKQHSVSLRDLLQDPRRHYILQLKQRVKLAVTLASSVLQLHATPWYEDLRSQSFLFTQREDGQLDLRHPFVACKIGKAPRTHLPAPSQAEYELLELGILIMELWHNDTMESFAEYSNIHLEDEQESRRSVARKWIAVTKDGLLTSVYDAATRCVNCRFDAVDIDLADVKVNTSIFENVIKPLWDNCKG